MMKRPNGAGELFLSIDDFVLLLYQFAYEGIPVSRSATRRAGLQRL
jgi:hypothetical protein